MISETNAFEYNIRKDSVISVYLDTSYSFDNK